MQLGSKRGSGAAKLEVAVWISLNNYQGRRDVAPKIFRTIVLPGLGFPFRRPSCFKDLYSGNICSFQELR